MLSSVIRGHSVNQGDILRAFRKFDSLYSNTNDYDSWLEKENYIYAVTYMDRLYPPKHILSEASNIPVQEFSGGDETNRVFRGLGFEVIPKTSAHDPMVEINLEYDYRMQLWGRLFDQGGPNNVAPKILRELGIYGGAQGIWVDQKRTNHFTASKYGVTVSVLHTGSSYPDDLLEDGIIYHYPRTKRPPGRDLSEIEATKSAMRLNLPLFLITYPSPNSKLRNVNLGWVEDWSDEESRFLIVFQSEPPKKHIQVIEDDPFQLTEERQIETKELPIRTDQQRFRMSVLRRYGAKCALCNIEFPSSASIKSC